MFNETNKASQGANDNQNSTNVKVITKLSSIEGEERTLPKCHVYFTQR